MSLSNLSIAQRFADGKTKGKGNHVFIEEDTIYSYGHHFPIAKRITSKFTQYLFNTNGYSMTTAKHKSSVLSAIGYKNVLYIMDCDLDNLGKQFESNNNKIKDLIEKHKRARTDWRKGSYNSKIGDLKQQNNLIENMGAELHIVAKNL